MGVNERYGLMATVTVVTGRFGTTMFEFLKRFVSAQKHVSVSRLRL